MVLAMNSNGNVKYVFSRIRLLWRSPDDSESEKEKHLLILHHSKIEKISYDITMYKLQCHQHLSTLNLSPINRIFSLKSGHQQIIQQKAL